MFVGDLIDRGPGVRATLELVKAMHDQKSALVVVGNHEYNAVGYSTMVDGHRLRQLSPPSLKQYRATEKEFQSDPDEWLKYIDWFKQLPVYLEFNQFRVIHACWSQRHIDFLQDRRLADFDFLQQSALRGSAEHNTIEVLLKGPELKLPHGVSYLDKDGHRRENIRVKWWRRIESNTYRSLSLPEQRYAPEIMAIPPGPELEWDIYPEESKPVFIGHYWLPNTEKPKPFGNVICLDYSVGKQGGCLVACSINSDKEIDTENLNYTIVPRED